MNDGKEILTFPRQAEFAKAKTCLDRLSLGYTIISPFPVYGLVGVDSLVMDQEARGKLFQEVGARVVCSGWVDYRPTKITTSSLTPPAFEEDILGTCSIMVMALCVADVTKIRLIVHIAGNLSDVLPYLNREMPQAMYCREAETFTYLDAYRMISLYPRRITIAKADELVDAWHTLEKIRCRVNETWARRSSIEPCWEMRKKPPALEIYKRLPGTNCRACGERTCLAFSVRLWSGEIKPSLCTPIFTGAYGHLRAPFLEICSSLGFPEMTRLDENE
jgi:ArsR family metal-binding transcriptional regulator